MDKLQHAGQQHRHASALCQQQGRMVVMGCRVGLRRKSAKRGQARSSFCLLCLRCMQNGCVTVPACCAGLVPLTANPKFDRHAVTLTLLLHQHADSTCHMQHWQM